MGGATGSFTLTGNITAYEQFLLSFADIFGAGKNTNFGLGDVRGEEKKHESMQRK